MFTPEDEIDVLHHELGRARRHLYDLERAPHEGRWTLDAAAWMDACANQRQRVRVLEHDLAALVAAEDSAEEAYEMDGAT